jgi:hypothetical protein
MLAPSLSFCPALFVSEALSLQSTIEKIRTTFGCKKLLSNISKSFHPTTGYSAYEENPEGEHANSNDQQKGIRV